MSDEKPRIFKQGGARHKQGPVTHALTPEHANQLTRGVELAKMAGMPLNRFISIHWGLAGLTGEKAAWATREYIKRVRDWLTSKGLPFAYIWIRENDDGDDSIGDHVHILAHVPKGQSLRHLQRRWIRAITGKPYVKSVVLTRTVARHVAAAEVSPDFYWINLKKVGGYMLKGISLGKGGCIVGQRFGISRNLSKLVQLAPVSDLLQTDVFLGSKYTIFNKKAARTPLSNRLFKINGNAPFSANHTVVLHLVFGDLTNLSDVRNSPRWSVQVGVRRVTASPPLRAPPKERRSGAGGLRGWPLISSLNRQRRVVQRWRKSMNGHCKRWRATLPTGWATLASALRVVMVWL